MTCRSKTTKTRDADYTIMDRNESRGSRLDSRRGGNGVDHIPVLLGAPIRIVLQGRPDCLRLVSYSELILAYAVEFKVLPRAISWYLPLFYFIFYSNMRELSSPG